MKTKHCMVLAASLSFGVCAFGDVQAVSGDGAWTIFAAPPAGWDAGEPWVRPAAFAPAEMRRAAMLATLAGAPLEGSDRAKREPLVMQIPMPDGTFARFKVVESPVMEPGLAVRFPDIKTYLGQGIDDPYATARLDLTPAGFHAQILSPSGAVYIDPYTRHDDTRYAVYYKRDLPQRGEPFRCLVGPEHGAGVGGIRPVRVGGSPTDASGDVLRTYRLAMACTGEFGEFHGGTVPLALAAIVTIVNRVTGIYEQEFAIRLTLVPNNDLIVFINAGTDPYSNFNLGAMLGQNQVTCTNIIGAANYDIGHVLGTAGGGLAQLVSVCSPNNKARAASSDPVPVGDPFTVGIVCHEIGHQFGGNHVQNGCSNNNTSTAYEPGSGSTIMGYAGICGTDDLQANSDPYFNSITHQEVRTFLNGAGGGCGQASNTGNGVPTVEAGPNRAIPSRTPFALTAVATDPNGDPLTYCWEQRDLGPYQNAVNGQFPDNGFSPIFRTFNAAASPTRTFPRLQNLLANNTVIGEFLPTTGRTLTFHCTVRDNRAGGGGVNSDSMQLSVIPSAGPFQVIFPNTAVSLTGQVNVTWSVAGTNLSPISVQNVRIDLSVDGGLTWPHTLAASTPNDGSHVVTLPSINTFAARIRVSAIGNVFFDVSNNNFSIVPTGSCYVNCDNSTAMPNLNINDFICFQQRFAAGDPYANCDQSTSPPVLNVDDFICFQHLFVQGCP